MLASSSTVSSIARLWLSAVLIRASSSRSSTGLERKSSAPASIPRTRSSTAFSAVISTTGISRVSGSPLRTRSALKPSMPGIITSSRTRSGGAAATRSSASSPFAAVSVTKPRLSSSCSR